MSGFPVTVLTVFPEMFPGPLGLSLAGKALTRGDWSLNAVNLRDFASDKHRSVDDTPFGGGAGMVMRPDVVAAAIDFVNRTCSDRPLIYLTPRGRPLTQALVQDLIQAPGMTLLCGRYEGVDQRVIEARGCIEISLGDFVLSGGELAAMALIDAAVRLLPGVVNREESVIDESFSTGLLEYPHYTRPKLWEGHEVPAVLLSGHHAEISAWRAQQARSVTAARRPDLLDPQMRQQSPLWPEQRPRNEHLPAAPPGSAGQVGA